MYRGMKFHKQHRSKTAAQSVHRHDRRPRRMGTQPFLLVTLRPSVTCVFSFRHIASQHKSLPALGLDHVPTRALGAPFRHLRRSHSDASVPFCGPELGVAPAGAAEKSRHGLGDAAVGGAVRQQRAAGKAYCFSFFKEIVEARIWRDRPK